MHIMCIIRLVCFPFFFFFFFNDTATTEIYTLSLHDALPISVLRGVLLPEGVLRLLPVVPVLVPLHRNLGRVVRHADRKSTRLNSSHSQISYAVFCLKKKKKHNPRYFYHTSSSHLSPSTPLHT